MRIAVTAMEKSLDAPVSNRFGRSLYVFVGDTRTRVVRIIDNHAYAALGLGAGAKTAEMLAKIGVDWVATGEIGRESFEILANSGIKVATCVKATCREALDRLERGGIPEAKGPTDPRGCVVPPTE
ncbi:MAG: NifB/NifX family molybdenum-iron cluster-binding protein [Acidobacteriota bacterium]